MTLEVTNDMATGQPGEPRLRLLSYPVGLIPLGQAATPAVNKFNCTKQLANQTVGRAEKTEVLSEGLLQLKLCINTVQRVWWCASRASMVPMPQEAQRKIISLRICKTHKLSQKTSSWEDVGHMWRSRKSTDCRTLSVRNLC